MLSYAPAAGAASIAFILAVVLLVAPIRSRVRGRRHRAREVAEALSPERRATLEQF